MPYFPALSKFLLYRPLWRDFYKEKIKNRRRKKSKARIRETCIRAIPIQEESILPSPMAFPSSKPPIFPKRWRRPAAISATWWRKGTIVIRTSGWCFRMWSCTGMPFFSRAENLLFPSFWRRTLSFLTLPSVRFFALL